MEYCSMKAFSSGFLYLKKKHKFPPSDNVQYNNKSRVNYRKHKSVPSQWKQWWNKSWLHKKLNKKKLTSHIISHYPLSVQKFLHTTSYAHDFPCTFITILIVIIIVLSLTLSQYPTNPVKHEKRLYNNIFCTKWEK